jgi:hypothetical protein
MAFVQHFFPNYETNFVELICTKVQTKKYFELSGIQYELEIIHNTTAKSLKLILRNVHNILNMQNEFWLMEVFLNERSYYIQDQNSWFETTFRNYYASLDMIRLTFVHVNFEFPYFFGSPNKRFDSTDFIILNFGPYQTEFRYELDLFKILVTILEKNILNFQFITSQNAYDKMRFFLVQVSNQTRTESMHFYGMAHKLCSRFHFQWTLLKSLPSQIRIEIKDLTQKKQFYQVPNTYQTRTKHTYQTQYILSTITNFYFFTDAANYMESTNQLALYDTRRSRKYIVCRFYINIPMQSIRTSSGIKNSQYSRSLRSHKFHKMACVFFRSDSI